MTDMATDEARGRLGGEVILPDDPGYDEARALHNAMIDKRPAVIARCGSAADVAGALEFARRSNLVVAVRGGGHNGPGFGTVEGGLVIDLSPMNRISGSWLPAPFTKAEADSFPTVSWPLSMSL